MNLTAGAGSGKILSAVEKYEKYHACYGGEEEERKSNYADMVNKYYDLATTFYEFGWGQSFHFAPRWKGESLSESIKRHEHFLALQLGLKAGQKVLDIGCGIGGPLKEISLFSSTSITGLNNNEFQIKRAKELTCNSGVEKTCNFVKGDFMKMPFPDNYFDAAYAIEATCHAPDAYACYKEIFRVLKPGGCFAAFEWCMTDVFDPSKKEHQKIKEEIEVGDGLPDIRLTTKCLEALKQAGFEVMEEKDLAIDHCPVPWYLPLDSTHFSLSNFRATSVGRFVTRIMVSALEFVGLAPKGSTRVLGFLQKAAEGLVAGGNSTSVTGLNNNEYQITRGEALNRIAGVDTTCNFVKADFMKMPFTDNSFDAVYAIEATCHAPDAYGCYKEIFRVLKPGQYFAAYEWCMTDQFDPNNEEHQKIKAEIEIGDGLPDIRLTTKCAEALKQAGFEVIWEKDLAIDSPVPWYFPLDTTNFSLNTFRLTAVGRFFTRSLVKGLEFVGLAPKGSLRVQEFLEKAAEGLVAGGKKEIFTPMYFFLARKPDSSTH